MFREGERWAEAAVVQKRDEKSNLGPQVSRAVGVSSEHCRTLWGVAKAVFPKMKGVGLEVVSAWRKINFVKN